MTRSRVQQSLVPDQAVLSPASVSASPPPDALPARIYSTAFGMTIRPRKYDEEEDETLASFRGDFDSMSINRKKKIITYTIIKAGLLIPGDGEPQSDAALVIEGKLIVWVGPERDLPAKYTDSPDSADAAAASQHRHRTFTIPVVMPGLWDVHAHFMDESPETAAGAQDAVFLEHPATAGARLTRGCWEALQRGYTSLRDVAGYGCELATAINDGTVVGPNVYSAGACLSQTGGHGDMFALPPGDVQLAFGIAGSAHSGHWGSTQAMLVDGVDECRRAVRLQIRRGAKCIKLFASGGVLSLDDDIRNAQFSPEELAVIVTEAARQGRAVAAHVHGKPGILAAVRAGVRTVEHVSFADEECIRLIRENDVVYVATRTIVEMLLRAGGRGLTRYQWEKAQLCGSHHRQAYEMAIRAGVRVALGTDTYPGSNMAMELDFAVQAGMTPLEAIRAATANGPLTLGDMAPKSGQIRVGYEADILGLQSNPVEDVKSLQDKQNVAWVWKGGRLFKGPGVGPWGEDPL